MITTVNFHVGTATDIDVRDIYPGDSEKQNITLRLDPKDYSHHHSIHIQDTAAAFALIDSIREGIELIREKEEFVSTLEEDK